jgi:hypothetical protein
MNVAIAFLAGAATPIVLVWLASKRAKHAAKGRRN